MAKKAAPKKRPRIRSWVIAIFEWDEPQDGERFRADLMPRGTRYRHENPVDIIDPEELLSPQLFRRYGPVFNTFAEYADATTSDDRPNKDLLEGLALAAWKASRN